MNIAVDIIPSTTYKLIGNEFYCSHDEKVIDVYYEYPSYWSPVEVEKQGYYCAGCGEPLEGDPELERREYLAEAEAEAQLMEILGK